MENHCGWTEKQTQDTLDDLKQVIKDKDEIIEVICVKHIFFRPPELKSQVSISKITRRLLSLCLSICKLLLFCRLIQTNFNQTLQKAFLGINDSNLFKTRVVTFSMGKIISTPQETLGNF